MRTAFALVMLAVLSACTTLKTPTFSNADGAIRGYDPVAYFVEGAPLKGDSGITHRFRNATWHFASEANRERFAAEPEKYAPQYGGYCAYAMSAGRVVSTDPQAWHIEDGRLYLNYSLRVRKTWLKDIPRYVREADVHWSEKTGD